MMAAAKQQSYTSLSLDPQTATSSTNTTRRARNKTATIHNKTSDKQLAAIYRLQYKD
jgi:hypothetical protein